MKNGKILYTNIVKTIILSLSINVIINVSMKKYNKRTMRSKSAEYKLDASISIVDFICAFIKEKYILTKIVS